MKGDLKMNISLEQVDEVISRTGTTYEKAKKALEDANGDVLEAIILIESDVESTFQKTNKVDDLVSEFINGLKDLVNKGNVTKIQMKKDDKVIVNIPITAGALGAFFFTSAAVAGLVVGLATGCSLEIIKEDGEVIDICEITEDTLNDLKEKINNCKDKVSKKESKEDSNVINILSKKEAESEEKNEDYEIVDDEEE